MKRQKRDPIERAFERGYQIGLAGKSKSLCPTETGPSHQEWLNGWRQGRDDYWGGMKPMSASSLASVNRVIIHHQH